MKRKEFKLLLDDYKQFQQNTTKMLDCGVDLFENTKYPVATYAEKFFQLVLKQNWSELGVDWINWFIYENDFGAKEMGAWDNEKNLICQTVDQLYDYCKQYKIKTK